MSEENVLSNKIEMKKVWQLLGIIAVTALIWNLPITCFGIEGHLTGHHIGNVSYSV